MSTHRIFALLLALVLSVSVLASCNQTPDPQEQTTPTPATESTTATTTPSAPVITPPEESDSITLSTVQFVTGESALELFCVAELEWYFAQKGIATKKNGYPITIAVDDKIAADGYKIEATENGLFITGGTNRGLAYALYNFLEKYVGVGFYAPDAVTTTDEPVILPFGVLDTFAPAFEILRNPWQPIEALSEKDGGNILYHDHLYKTLTLNTLTGIEATAQPCLSDAKNLTAAINYAKDFLAKYPGLITLTFAPTSGTHKYCTCDNCSAIYAEEGSVSGTYVRFVNAIIEAVSADYPNLSFAVAVRGYLQSAPTVTKLADNVTVYISTEECHATHPITDENCPTSVAFVQNLKSWIEAGKVRLEYVLTSNDYISTFPNFGALRENMQFFAASGIDSFYCSGNLASPSGEFAELRAYLISKLLHNPSMSEEEYSALMNEFLIAYYGNGWFYVRQYINKTTELANNQTADGKEPCGQTVSDDVLTVITREEYANHAHIFESYWNAAEELAGDRISSVKLSRLQWQYMKLFFNPNADEANALITAASKARLSWRENKKSVVAGSDLSLMPSQWQYAS